MCKHAYMSLLYNYIAYNKVYNTLIYIYICINMHTCHYCTITLHITNLYISAHLYIFGLIICMNAT